MNQTDLAKIKMIDEWIEMLESMIRDLKNERNKIILEKGENNE